MKTEEFLRSVFDNFNKTKISETLDKEVVDGFLKIVESY